MAFGTAETLKLSLDRSDLWYCGHREKPHRINAGCLMLPSPGSRFEEGLDLYAATAFRDTGAWRYEWFVHARRRLICLSAKGGAAAEYLTLRWQEPELYTARDIAKKQYELELKPSDACDAESPYANLTKAAFRLEGKLGIIEFFIEGILHFRVKLLATTDSGALMMKVRENGFDLGKANGRFNLFIAVDNPPQGVENSIPAPLPDYRKLHAEHVEWWANHWNGPYIALNHHAGDRFWHMGRYLIGSAMRPDAPPVPLQGVWGESSPPWRGEYTWDLNVQTCYWPTCASGSHDSILALAKWFNQHLEVFNQNSVNAFGSNGLLLPLNTDFNGRTQSHFDGKSTPSHGVWTCQVLWEYYRYTGCLEFLQQYCVGPFTAQMSTLKAVWEKTKDGMYLLEASESPELNMLSTAANPCRNSAYDIAFSRFLTRTWLEMSQVLGLKNDGLNIFAKDFLSNSPPYPESAVTAKNYYWPEEPVTPGYFVEWQGLETEMSHRHLSHLVNVYPIAELSSASAPETVRKLQNTMQRLQARGFGNWEPYSFGWASILNSRIGWRPRYSLNMLAIMHRYMTVKFNGIPMNDDYLGYGLFNQTGPYGPGNLGAFTLESALIPMTAVQEAVAHTASDGKTTVLGSGLAEDAEGYFEDLRLPGNKSVSGRIQGGAVVAPQRPGLV